MVYGDISFHLGNCVVNAVVIPVSRHGDGGREGVSSRPSSQGAEKGLKSAQLDSTEGERASREGEMADTRELGMIDLAKAWKRWEGMGSIVQVEGAPQQSRRIRLP